MRYLFLGALVFIVGFFLVANVNSVTYSDCSVYGTCIVQKTTLGPGGGGAGNISGGVTPSHLMYACGNNNICDITGSLYDGQTVSLGSNGGTTLILTDSSGSNGAFQATSGNYFAQLAFTDGAYAGYFTDGNTNIYLANNQNSLDINAGLPAHIAPNTTIDGNLTVLGNINVNGMPLPFMVNASNVSSQTVAVNITSFNTTQQGTYRIGGWVGINSIATDIAQFQIQFTDYAGNLNTKTLLPAGSTSANLASTGSNPFSSIDAPVKKGTKIVVSVVLTNALGSINYDAEGNIQFLTGK